MKIIAEKARIDDIADAVRQKLNVETQYKLSEIPAAINNIYVGGELEPLSAAANGDYTPGTGIEGFSRVHVAVPGPTLATKNIVSNGTYNASSDNVDGYSSVIVNVPGGVTIEPLQVTENGTYNPPSGVDGYAPVTVNVSGGEVPSAKLKVGPVFEQLFSLPKTSVYGTMINGGATQFITPVKDDGAEAKVDLSLPFEICCTFMLTNAPSANTGRNVFGAIGNYWECPAIAAYNGKFAYFFTTASGKWTHNAITITPSGYSVPLNTWIVAKITYDGTKYTFSIDDGTVQASQELTGVTTYYNSNYRFCFGSQANSTTYAIAQTGAKIKIAGTYLKQNGVLIWGYEE